MSKRRKKKVVITESADCRSQAQKIWKILNNGFTGYVFYIFLGIVAAIVLTNFLGIALETSVPLVAVVSGSMDHGINDEGYPCDKKVPGYTENFESWWTLCDFTYEDFNLTEQEFSEFPFSNGLKRGDIAVLQNNNGIEVGDIIVYNIPSQGIPIIHRVVAENGDGTYQTKGDHNPGQNNYETSISADQIRGKAIFVIPYLGYLRVLLPID